VYSIWLVFIPAVMKHLTLGPIEPELQTLIWLLVGLHAAALVRL
jgi:hypothetical protein